MLLLPRDAPNTLPGSSVMAAGKPFYLRVMSAGFFRMAQIAAEAPAKKITQAWDYGEIVQRTCALVAVFELCPWLRSGNEVLILLARRQDFFFFLQ